MTTYTKLSDTVAEKTETTEKKDKISLAQAKRRVAFLEAELKKAKDEVIALEKLGLK